MNHAYVRELLERTGVFARQVRLTTQARIGYATPISCSWPLGTDPEPRDRGFTSIAIMRHGKVAGLRANARMPKRFDEVLLQLVVRSMRRD